MKRIFLPSRWVLLALIGLPWGHAKQDPKGDGLGVKPGPTEVMRLKRDDLASVTGIATSSDSKFCYSASFNAGKVGVFTRAAETGKLTHLQTLVAPELQGPVAIKLSNDDKYAAVSCFINDSLALLSRDGETGKVKLVDSVSMEAQQIEALDFCIDHVFSPDGNFVCAIGSRGIAVFQIVDNQLQIVQELLNKAGENLFSDGRGIAISRDGKMVYSSWRGSGAVVAFSRNPNTGLLTKTQVIKEEPGVNGVMHITLSPDGRFAFSAGGRFGGNTAVCVFAINPAGRLKLVQTLMNGDLPAGFEGGNDIQVSPEGTEIAVAATISDDVAFFNFDPGSGKLKFWTSTKSGEQAVPGACGLSYSPDGKSLTVADESSSSILVYQRKRF